MSRLKVAVAGVGYLGYYHAQKYVANDSAELIGVVDVDAERAKEVADEFGVAAFTDFRDLIGKVRAVSVAVTTSEHLKVAGELLAAGIHCLVEKPITTSLDEADRLIEAAESSGAIIQVGHLERFNPAVAALSELLDEPLMIEAKRLTPYRGRGIDVDVVLDLMIHDIDIVLSLAGQMPSDIKALGAAVITERPDVAHARLEFPSGLVAELTATRVSSQPCRQIQVLQSHSHVSVDCAARSLSVFTRTRLGGGGEEIMPGVTVERRQFEASDPLSDEIAAFIHSANGGPPPLVGGREGRQALEVALEIADMIAAGRGAATGGRGRVSKK